MNFKIENCKDGDADYIIDRLVEYNLSKVPAEQDVLFDILDKKITEDNGNTIAGCVARMYCWNVAYVAESFDFNSVHKFSSVFIL